MKTISVAVCSIALLLIASFDVHAQAAPTRDAVHVVIVQSGNSLLPANLIGERAIRDALVAAVESPVTFHVEPLDALENMAVDADAQHFARLRDKYARTRVDLIIAVTAVALELVLHHREELWPDVPVIYCAVSVDAIDHMQPPHDVGGVAMTFDVAGTLDLAFRLQPNASKVVYIAGVAPYDQGWTPMFREAIAPYRERVSVTEWIGHPLTALRREVSELPADVIVLYASIFRDTNGERYVPGEVARPLARESGAPVYGLLGNYIEAGVVGGSVVDIADHGREVGTLAARVIHSQEMGGPVTMERSLSVARCSANMSELRRRKMAVERLPHDCSRRFASPSPWEQHRTAVLLMAFAGILSGALALEMRRRRRAETEAHLRREETAHAARLAMIGEITASVTHEVTQPLSAILSNADAASMLLEKPDPSLDEIRQILDDIRADNKRAYEIVRRLRTLMKERQLQKEVVDLNGLIRSVAALIRTDAFRRNIVVHSNLDPDLPRIEGDSVHLQQVLLNLLINGMDSIDKSSGDRRIDIATSRHDDRHVVVAVADTGAGIDPAHLQQLFTAFFTTKSDGVGLGLSISRIIVEAHDGRIWAQANGPRGAVFRFTIPICSDATRS